MNAGLTENEAEVYLLLLQEDSSLASALASDTKISRPHVYDSLNKLIEKGLASYVIKNNRKYFRSANPKELPAGDGVRGPRRTGLERPSAEHRRDRL